MKLTTYIERNGLNIPVTVRQYLGKGYRGGYLGHRFAILPMESGKWMCFIEDDGYGLIRGMTPKECIATLVMTISSHMEKSGKIHEVRAYEKTHGIPKGIQLPQDRVQIGLRLDTRSASGPWLSINVEGEK